MNVIFKKPKQNRIFQHVVDEIQSAILDGRIKAGDQLPSEMKLKELFETSRGSIREALREEMLFENGRILNARFSQYLVPRFEDVPELDIHLVDRPDIEPAGGGETPIIAIGPAIANAVFDAIGARVREMPIKL